MDFATIKVSAERKMNVLLIKCNFQKNLVKAKITTYEELFSEVQLIWDNCKSYNIAGSDIFKLAEYMEKLTKRAILKFRSQMGIQQVAAAPAN